VKPVVVLVGRPNVGKSTLFNALTRRRDALVADLPGLTRDRQYGHGRVGDRPYLVVDTGGLTASQSVDSSSASAETIEQLMAEQTRQAIIEADAILFMVDGREGPNALDQGIARELRKLGKPVTLVVNKAEGLDPATVTAEFHAFGLGEPSAISASHGDGMQALMERVLAPLPHVAEVAEEEETGDIPRIAIAGRPNVGKSTLVNALLGEERVVVADQAGTTRDSIRIPLERAGRHYILIDTAGVRRRARVTDVIEKYSVIKTLQAIDEANVVILVLDAQQEVSEQDVSLAGYVMEQGRALVLAVNKWDGLEPSRRDWIKRELERKLPFLSFAKPHFISAKESAGLGPLFPAVDRAFASARKELPTPMLNRVLERAVQQTPPPLIHSRRPRLKYAHQGGRNPPLIVIHGNQLDVLPDFYRRYLINQFRDAFDLEGTPIRIDLVKGENPYAPTRHRPKLTARKAAIKRRDRRIKKKREKK
jgi:GTP-binding protein